MPLFFGFALTFDLVVAQIATTGYNHVALAVKDIEVSARFYLKAPKMVCFTIDDLPVVPYRHRGADFELKMTEKLLEKLARHQIPAIGFVNEGKLFKNGNLNPERVNLLKLWLRCGLELGNHTYSHIDFNGTDFDSYFNEIIRGEIHTKKLMAEFGKTPRYFRHPYLHAGETKEKADSLQSFLAGAGYQIAPVTLDNEEYVFAYAYDSVMVIKDTVLMKKTGEAYIDYMEKKLQYFENQSAKLFGRNIRHTLLIHANALNADYMDELADMFKKNGYQFVSLEEALKDKAYETEVAVFGKWGISWLDRWALSAGHKGEFFQGEPETPAFVKKLAKQ